MVLQLKLQSAFTSVHGPMKKVSPRSTGSGCTHFWHSLLMVYGFCQFILNLKLSSILWSETFVRADPKINLVYSYLSIYFTHLSMCVWRMLTLVRESCDSC